MITNSTLQSLNKFKLVYKSAFIGLLTNILLDVPIMSFSPTIGLPPSLGPSTASIIGYSISALYALYNLKKEHALSYKATLDTIKKLIIPIICMIVGVLLIELLFTNIIHINYDNKFMCIVEIGVVSIIGSFIYLGILIKSKTLQKVLGEHNYKKIMRKLTFNKINI